jgi:hypothetical protein
VTQPPLDELLTIQELADALKRSRRYVSAMRSAGFKMPGDRGTLRSALAWLDSHPVPTSPRWRIVKRLAA